MNELDLCCIFAAMKATGIMNAIINTGHLAGSQLMFHLATYFYEIWIFDNMMITREINVAFWWLWSIMLQI